MGGCLAWTLEEAAIENKGTTIMCCVGLPITVPIKGNGIIRDKGALVRWSKIQITIGNAQSSRFEVVSGGEGPRLTLNLRSRAPWKKRKHANNYISIRLGTVHFLH